MPDSMSAHNVAVDADGNATFDFDGHIHADGLDLDAGDAGPNPPNDRRIRWLKLADGTVVAELIAYHNAADSSRTLSLETRRNAGDDAASQLLVDGALIRARKTAAGLELVEAEAGAVNRKIIDETGASSFADRPVPTAQIQDGAVTTAKFAAGAKAPDAELLDGLDSLRYLRSESDLAGRYRGRLTAAQFSALGSLQDLDWCEIVMNTIPYAFRYNAGGGTHKWECIGGAAMYDSVLTQQGQPSANTWQNLATVGPQLTVPLRGVYLAEVTAQMIDSSTTAWGVGHVGVSVGGSAAPAKYARGMGITTAGLNIGSPCAVDDVVTTTAANTNLVLLYNSTQTSMFWFFRTLAVMPIRVQQ